MSYQPSSNGRKPMPPSSGTGVVEGPHKGGVNLEYGFTERPAPPPPMRPAPSPLEVPTRADHELAVELVAEVARGAVEVLYRRCRTRPSDEALRSVTALLCQRAAERLLRGE